MKREEIVEALERGLNLGDTPVGEFFGSIVAKTAIAGAIELIKRNDEIDARNYAQVYMQKPAMPTTDRTIIDRQNISNGRYYGTAAQMVVLIEECAELAQAATKWLRVHTNGHTVRKNPAEVRDNMIEELADVGIMLDQICDLLNVSDRELNAIREAKIKRTAEYIKIKERPNRHPFYYSAEEAPHESETTNA